MKHTIEYFIRRKSDNKFISMNYVEVTEEEICEWAKEKMGLPIHMDKDDYEFSDISISETVI